MGGLGLGLSLIVCSVVGPSGALTLAGKFGRVGWCVCGA